MELEPRDVVRVDGEKYYVKSVVDSMLIRLRFQDDVGFAKFDNILSSATTVSHYKYNASIERVSKQRFEESINRFVTKKPSMGAFITLPVEADQYYLSKEYNAGYAIRENELVGLFNDTGPSGLGESLIIHSISNGVEKLFCYDTYLSSIYKKFGFVEYDRETWNDALASSDWDYDKFEKPDVVWMKIEKSKV